MPIDEFRNSGPPIGEAEVEELERHLKVTLPEQYRRFLLQHNGGSPHPQEAFAALGDRDRGSVVFVFYAVIHQRRINTLAQNRLAFDGRIPSDLLAIATDAFSNQVCIGIGKKNRGTLFFWDIGDEAGPGKRPWRRNIWVIAETFDEFVDSFFDLEAEPM